jgi:hypothetical protein
LSDRHVHDPGLDAHAAVIELGVIHHHFEALRLVLLCEADASTGQCFVSAISWPSETQIPPAQGGGNLDRASLAHAIRLGDIDHIIVAIPTTSAGSPALPLLRKGQPRPGGYRYYQQACYQQRGDGAWITVAPQYCATAAAAPVEVAPPPRVRDELGDRMLQLRALRWRRLISCSLKCAADRARDCD